MGAQSAQQRILGEGRIGENNGLQDVRIQVSTYQEPAMINIQIALQELQPNRIIPINSPVGESESNGRVENVIRRVQEKIRVVKHHVSCHVGGHGLRADWREVGGTIKSLQMSWSVALRHTLRYHANCLSLIQAT